MAASCVSNESIIMSGDHIEFLFKLADLHKNKIILGPGLIKTENKVKATKCGILKRSNYVPNLYLVESFQKRYIAEQKDDVIGIVTNKTGDMFTVDIGASKEAIISALAFEGATRKLMPQLRVGDLLYAKLLLACKCMQPELVCVDRYGKSKGLWGELKGGFMFNASINLIHKLRNPKFDINKTLVKLGVFEIAVGMNGRIWVKSRNVTETIAIVNAISLMEFGNGEIEHLSTV